MSSLATTPAIFAHFTGKNCSKTPIKSGNLYTLMPNPTRIFFSALATLVAAGSLTLLSGCKGNTTSAAILEKVVSPPPTVTALPAEPKAALADPLTELPWATTHFSPFVSPINTDRSAPPARAALLYDANNLYVAFISDTANTAPDQDTVSVFLDSSPNTDGKQLLQVSVRHDGTAAATWMYAAEAPTKRDDGSPNFHHPLVTVPNYALDGLVAKTRDAQEKGHRVWTAVVTIPLKSVPLPLRTSPTPGSHWKVNLLRTVTTDLAGNRQRVQSNLSPVYVDAQPVSPYRLAELFLSPGAMTADASPRH
jgi:hypothetical protein